MAIRFLGQTPPKELNESDVASFWKWIMENWKPQMISLKNVIPPPATTSSS
jgi:glutamyl-Q tRNA(Asp) synthetase